MRKFISIIFGFVFAVLATSGVAQAQQVCRCGAVTGMHCGTVAYAGNDRVSATTGAYGAAGDSGGALWSPTDGVIGTVSGSVGNSEYAAPRNIFR